MASNETAHEDILEQQLKNTKTNGIAKPAGSNMMVEPLPVPYYLYYIPTAVAVFGICFNILALTVWSLLSRQDYVPSIYLFKALAVADLFYLLVWFFYDGDNVNRFEVMFVSIITFGNRKLGLLITMILAFIRVVIIYRDYATNPRNEISKRKLRLIVFITLTLNMWLQGYLDSNTVITTTYPRIVQVTLRRISGYMVPSIVQFVLMMMVVWKVCRHHSDWKGNEHLFNVALVVLIMCTFSFLAYFVPTGITVINIFTKMHPRYKVLMDYIDRLLTVLNSSINLLLYLFLPKFREVLSTLVRGKLPMLSHFSTSLPTLSSRFKGSNIQAGTKTAEQVSHPNLPPQSAKSDAVDGNNLQYSVIELDPMIQSDADKHFLNIPPLGPPEISTDVDTSIPSLSDELVPDEIAEDVENPNLSIAFHPSEEGKPLQALSPDPVMKTCSVMNIITTWTPYSSDCD